jgi:RimJ/RimL family protein N-acetyltransferase
VRFRDEPQTAEMSIVVVDDYQGNGIGRLLLDALVLEANAVGITRFTGEVLTDNKGIRRLLDDCGARFEFSGHGTFTMRLDLAPYVAGLRDAPMYDRLQELVSESAARPERPEH